SSSAASADVQVVTLKPSRSRLSLSKSQVSCSSSTASTLFSELIAAAKSSFRAARGNLENYDVRRHPGSACDAFCHESARSCAEPHMTELPESRSARRQG